MKFNNKLQDIVCKHLDQKICKGILTVKFPGNQVRKFVGATEGTEAYIEIFNWDVINIIQTRGDIGLGEAYIDGKWNSPDLIQLFTLLIDNIDDLEEYANGNIIAKYFFRFLNNIIRRNSQKGSAKNISSHYDVGNDFYSLWLDKSMTYSSALFADNDNLTLEEAQYQKYDRILKQINESRRRILEVGCGWGGFAERASKAGHDITGITISKQQYNYSKERLGNNAKILLKDYRSLEGEFDAIVSIEMFEAVGLQYWSNYFSVLKSHLAKNGVAVIQTITIKDEIFNDYVKRGDYIRHYVFPGGLLPSEKEFKQIAQKEGLICNNVHFFGQDYARTLKEWLSRFELQLDEVRKLGYNESFIRSWRLYLSMCSASFKAERTNVMQVELRHA